MTDPLGAVVTCCDCADEKGDPLTLLEVFRALTCCPGMLLIVVEPGEEPVLVALPNDLPKGEYDFFSGAGVV